MDLECFSCFIKSLLSALWLVDDNAAVSLRYVLTRDRTTTFFFVFQLVPSVVLPAVFLVISWLIHVHSWTSAHLKPETAQDVITPCSSRTCLTGPNLMFCGKTSEVVPSFPFPGHLPILAPSHAPPASLWSLLLLSPTRSLSSEPHPPLCGLWTTPPSRSPATLAPICFPREGLFDAFPGVVSFLRSWLWAVLSFPRGCLFITFVDWLFQSQQEVVCFS